MNKDLKDRIVQLKLLSQNQTRVNHLFALQIWRTSNLSRTKMKTDPHDTGYKYYEISVNIVLDFIKFSIKLLNRIWSRQTNTIKP